MSTIPGYEIASEPYFTLDKTLSYKYVSFNPHRSIGIPMVKYIKPDNMYRSTKEILMAQKLLFPESWQVNTLIYAFKKDIFPSPVTYHLGFDKIEMTRAIRACFPGYIPKTEIYANTTAHFYNLVEEFGLPFVCKEVRSSSGFGVHLINTEEEFLMFKQNNPTVYVQEHIKCDRDLRVVVIGDRAVDSYWRIKEPGSFHCNLARGAKISRKDIPRDVVDEVLGIALFLKIDYAGFDIALTETGLKIFEFNLYFGTKGIRLNSVDLGNEINQYLRRQAFEMDFIPKAFHCRANYQKNKCRKCLAAAEFRR